MRLFTSVLISLFFAASAAQAVTISNCDPLPREVTINHGGEIRSETVPAGRSIELFGAMISAKVSESSFITLERHDVYCIRKNRLSLQMRRPLSDGRR